MHNFLKKHTTRYTKQDDSDYKNEIKTDRSKCKIFLNRHN
jgi:hypothetical protein